MNKKRGFIRPLCIVFAFVFISAMMPVNVSAASTKQKALKAYNKLLSQSKINWRNGAEVKTSDCSFAIVYIDNNNVPELVLHIPFGILSMADGCGILYTYKNGKAIKLQNMDLFTDDFAYYKKTGIFQDQHTGRGWTETTTSKLSSAKISKMLLEEDGNAATGTNASNAWYKYSANGKMTKITKNSYNKSLKSLTKGKKVTKAKFYKNTASNRTKVLK